MADETKDPLPEAPGTLVAAVLDAEPHPISGRFVLTLEPEAYEWLRAALSAPAPEPQGCQHTLAEEHQWCRHGLYFGATCVPCICECPECWDSYSLAASFCPRPPEPRVLRASVSGAPEGVGERCDACGRRYPDVWRSPPVLWANVTGRDDEGGLLCMPCFAAKAQERGISLYWECRANEYPTAPGVSGAPSGKWVERAAQLGAALEWNEREHPNGVALVARALAEAAPGVSAGGRVVNGTCCACGYSGPQETSCPKRADRTHCDHWWDGPDEAEVCRCGAPRSDHGGPYGEGTCGPGCDGFESPSAPGVSAGGEGTGMP